MADSKGVRGPGGPPRGPAPKGPVTPASPRRAALERVSLRWLLVLQRVPRWLVVVLMAAALFLGLIQSGSLAWLGGVLMLIVAVFLGWLVALMWPALTPGRRLVRVIVVAAIVGLAILKFADRF